MRGQKGPETHYFEGVAQKKRRSVNQGWILDNQVRPLPPLVLLDVNPHLQWPDASPLVIAIESFLEELQWTHNIANLILMSKKDKWEGWAFDA